MTGFRNRFGALLSWWFAFTRDLRRERTFTSTEVGAGRDVYAVGAAGARPGPAGAAGARPEPAGAAGGAAKPGPAPGPDQRRPA
jgi:hypothetical protein